MFLYMLCRDRLFNRFVRNYHMIMYLVSISFGPSMILSHIVHVMFYMIDIPIYAVYIVPWTLLYVFCLLMLFEEGNDYPF